MKLFQLEPRPRKRSLSHTKFVQFVQNQNVIIVKTRLVFPPEIVSASEMLKHSRVVSMIVLVDVECIGYS